VECHPESTVARSTKTATTKSQNPQHS